MCGCIGSVTSLLGGHDGAHSYKLFADLALNPGMGLSVKSTHGLSKFSHHVTGSWSRATLPLLIDSDVKLLIVLACDRPNIHLNSIHHNWTLAGLLILEHGILIVQLNKRNYTFLIEFPYYLRYLQYLTNYFLFCSFNFDRLRFCFVLKYDDEIFFSASQSHNLTSYLDAWAIPMA